MVNKILLIIVLLLAYSSTSDRQGAEAKASVSAVKPVYTLVPADWGIYTDGTHPVETTKGLNDALKWAHDSGIAVFKVPAGTYLIKKQDPKLWLDTSARINMVSDITFELDPNAVIQKETNGFAGYQTLHIGYGANNVTIKGGTYKGDKDTHDYSSGGTHEGGYGITTEGAVNVTIDGVKAINFTGDGLAVGGKGTMVKDIYEDGFVSGSIDDQGKLVPDSGKIRLKTPLNFSNPIFLTEHEFEFSNGQKLSATFDVFFYKADGTFLSRLKDQRFRQIMQIPDGAASFYAVFNQPSSTGAYFEFWQRAVSKNVTIRNSEFAYNRRQGITIGGGDRVTVVNNVLHDMKGAAPQSGIDVEAGYAENGHLNTNISILSNTFYNNAAYDVILYDGRGAVVEGNRLGSKGKIGLSVSQPFTGADVINNIFDGTSIYAYHDVSFTGNEMINSFTHLEGPRLSIDGMSFTDSKFIISSSVPFGVSASNITMYNKNGGSEMSLWVNPIRLTNIALNGVGLTGGVPEGSLIDSLKITAAGSLNLPLGTYTNCSFESASTGAAGIFLDDPGRYQFNNCTFKVREGITVTNAKADFAMANSVFELTDRRFALKAVQAKKIEFRNNTIQANSLVDPSDYLVMIGDYWTRTNPYKVLDAVISGNTISSNLAGEGISTIYAGVGAPPYRVENNVLIKNKLKLRPSDININNAEK